MCVYIYIFVFITHTHIYIYISIYAIVLCSIVSLYYCFIALFFAKQKNPKISVLRSPTTRIFSYFLVMLLRNLLSSLKF